MVEGLDGAVLVRASDDPGLDVAVAELNGRMQELGAEPLSVQADLDFGSFLSGTRRGITTTVTARRGASLSTGLRVSHQDVNLPEGDFTRTLLGLRLGYFFTPRIYLQSLVQYSDQEEIWSANVRFGWLNTAGTGLFLVYNGVQNTGSFLETGLPRGPMERSFIVKYTRQFTLFGG